MATFYRDQGQFDKAESLYLRSLNIQEKVLGSEHSDLADTLNNIAILYLSVSRYEEAESLFQRAMTIREKVLGPEHPNSISSRNGVIESRENLRRIRIESNKITSWLRTAFVILTILAVISLIIDAVLLSVVMEHVHR